MKNLKWLVLGYFIAFCTQGCDVGITSSNNDTIAIDMTNAEYGDYGTVSWNPIYVKIVD
tara:strand:- start:198 stop:374 length:177 start_codon:yes stop_codon:yes gene_type:complete